MALFDVPGWSMPSDIKPVSHPNSRKRRRGDVDEPSSNVASAEVNVEKLMEKLNKQETGLDGNKNGKRKRKEKPARVEVEQQAVAAGPEGTRTQHRSVDSTHEFTSKPKHEQSKKRVKGNQDKPVSAPDDDVGLSAFSVMKQNETGEDISAKSKGKKGKKKEATNSSTISEHLPKPEFSGSTNAHLTNLQAKMMQKLDGARFRWINEVLYKSNSKDAERLMHEDPQVFEEYHAGFRHQVTSWPANPVDHFVQTLSSSYPERSVIVDLGCGDAALAQKLVPKGYTVLSFDLISANPFIVAADICEKVPLPGSEIVDEGQVVDVVVCSLSLMSTNWLNCIREARRILKNGGELKIAEVTSRFTNVDKFTSVISSVGFRLVSKDERNTHFTLFSFKKAEGSKVLDDKVWQKIMSRGDVLQPCEYKRR